MNAHETPGGDEQARALQAAAAACNDLTLQVISAALADDQELLRDTITGHAGDYTEKRDESETILMLTMALHSLAVSVASALTALGVATGEDMAEKYRQACLETAAEEEDGK